MIVDVQWSSSCLPELARSQLSDLVGRQKDNTQLLKQRWSDKKRRCHFDWKFLCRRREASIKYSKDESMMK